MSARFVFLFSLLLLLAACGSSPEGDDLGVLDGDVDAAPPDAGDAGVDAGPPTARVAYDGTTLYDAPFPDERLRRADGTIDLSGFPNPRAVDIIDQLRLTLSDADGFGASSGYYFALTRPVDTSTLPDMDASETAGASVYLMDVDPTSPEVGRRFPVYVDFDLDGGPLGAPNFLSVLPLQGVPLAPHRLYAAVLTTGVHAMDGAPMLPADATAMMVAGRRPPGLSDTAYAAHTTALAQLAAHGVDTSTLVATAVVRTGDPVAALRDAREEVLAAPLPTPDTPYDARETFPDFCVFHTTIRMPDFQAGTPWYAMPADGGGWAYDASGHLVVQDTPRSNVWITVPRAAMPAAGFPVTMFVRTGGGGDRPLVDRGAQAVEGGPAITPGTGPAMGLAQARFAGIQVDGPLGGLRNTAGWDEQFAIFNITNPAALRDNIRQSALELILFAHVVPTLTFDASSCAGLTTPAGDGVVRFDASTLTLMSHSMGSTIAPLAIGLEPMFRAAILSGAGASWIENVIYKLHPLAVRPLAELALGYTPRRQLTAHDISLALLQWAGEPADPMLYARMVAPRHVLMFQGILDTYIPPPVANPLTLSLGLDLAGPELDGAHPEYTPISSELEYAGGVTVVYPAMGNRGAGTATAVVTQHLQDSIEDGHEVMFQTEPPKRQYRCFLESLRTGVPRVVDGAGDPTTCD